MFPFFLALLLQTLTSSTKEQSPCDPSGQISRPAPDRPPVPCLGTSDLSAVLSSTLGSGRPLSRDITPQTPVPQFCKRLQTGYPSTLLGTIKASFCVLQAPLGDDATQRTEIPATHQASLSIKKLIQVTRHTRGSQCRAGAESKGNCPFSHDSTYCSLSPLS